MRLAVIISHPIQYFSPWFQFLAAQGWLDLRVFYLWTGGGTTQLDHGFGKPVKWDIPLLEGYAHEFVPNQARKPGARSFFELNNPELPGRVSQFKPDAALLFGYNYLTQMRFLFSRTGREIPLIFRGDSHRLVPARGWRAGLRRRWISMVYRRCAAFLPVGQANRDYFRQHGVPEEKLFFAPHAVDNERFLGEAATAATAAADWKRTLGIGPEQRVILFAGKFEPKKRPRDLVAAFKQADLKNTTLLLVGNGEQEADLRRDAAPHPHIVFAPFQNQTQMPRTYAAGDIFVLPSFGGGETWGLAVNEAMCLSRPVIVSSHVGCGPDLVRPRVNGLIFPAGDIAALAGALREALADPERLHAWGRQSREIIQGYDYAHAAAGLRAAMEWVKQKRH